MGNFQRIAQPPPIGTITDQAHRDAFAANQETQQKLGALLDILAPYFPAKRIVSTDGKVYDVLATDTAQIALLVDLDPFELVDVSTGTADSKVFRARMVSSLIYGDTPNGFNDGDTPPYIMTLSGSSGVFYAGLTIDRTNGVVSESGRFVGFAADMPEDSDGTFYERIGSYTIVDNNLVLVNDRYGPIFANVCPDYYKPANERYGVTFL